MNLQAQDVFIKRRGFKMRICLLLLSFFLLLSCSDSPESSARTSLQSVKLPKSVIPPSPTPKASPPATTQTTDPVKRGKGPTPTPKSSGSADNSFNPDYIASLPLPSAPNPAPTPTPSVLEQFDKHLATVIQNNIEILDACSKYSVLMAGEAIRLNWRIDQNGRPKNIQVEENQLNNRLLANCVVNFLKTVKFERKWKDFTPSLNFILYADESVSA